MRVRILKINQDLRDQGLTWDEVEQFWADVFKECKERGLMQETETCPHEISLIEVIFSCVTCETTQVVCKSCKKQLTEPKTDC